MATEKRDYTKQDLEESLRRAFVNGKADSIIVDGHTARNKFLREAVELGLREDWIYYEKTVGDEQWTGLRYRLTDNGKEYFGMSQ